MLIHLPYDDFSWEYLRDEDSPDTFCIEYDLVDENGETIPEQIQIVSKQVPTFFPFKAGSYIFSFLTKQAATVEDCDVRKIKLE